MFTGLDEFDEARSVVASRYLSEEKFAEFETMLIESKWEAAKILFTAAAVLFAVFLLIKLTFLV